MTCSARLTWFSLACICLATPVFARDGDSLVADLRILVGQTAPSNSNWTDAQLLQILNMAQDKVSAKGRVIEKDTTLAGGSLRYARPEGFITLRGTAYLVRTGIEIVPIPLVNADSMGRTQLRMTRQASGTDKFVIYEESDDIVVSPPVYVSDSVKVVYYANAQGITDTAECDYEDEWEMVLLYEAKVIAMEKVQNGTWYEKALAERDRLLAQVYAQTRLRPQLVKQP